MQPTLIAHVGFITSRCSENEPAQVRLVLAEIYRYHAFPTLKSVVCRAHVSICCFKSAWDSLASKESLVRICKKKKRTNFRKEKNPKKQQQQQKQRKLI